MKPVVTRYIKGVGTVTGNADEVDEVEARYAPTQTTDEEIDYNMVDVRLLIRAIIQATVYMFFICAIGAIVLGFLLTTFGYTIK